MTKELITRLTEGKKIYVVAGSYRGRVLVRFVVCSRLCKEEDVTYAWNEITKQATAILKSQALPVQEESHGSLLKMSNDITKSIQGLNLESKTQTIS